MSDFCGLAKKIIKEDIICSGDCPLIEKCPRLIMEDAIDKAVESAVTAMIGLIKEYRGTKRRK